MENTARNYEEFTWKNQIIDEKLVNFVRVRIFNPIDTVSSNGNKKLVVTDGNIIQKSSHSLLRYTSDYSYVILSTGIRERSTVTSDKSYLYLYITVYLRDSFDVSMWEDKDFLEKPFVLEALKEKLALVPKPNLTPLLKYIRLKGGADYEEFYQNLRASAQEYDFDKVEELFENYKISFKYQALFWKEMYQEIAKRRH